MLTALREEVAATEQRLEDERFAAASARQSFAAREQELEVTFFEWTLFGSFCLGLRATGQAACRWQHDRLMAVISVTVEPLTQ